MGPSSARKIEVEESNTPTARPLDAALRQTTTNDSDSVENDNPRPRDAAIRQQSGRATRIIYKSNVSSQNPSYTSTDQQFNDSYAQQGLQPSIGSVSQYRNVQMERDDGRSTAPAQLETTQPLRRTDPSKPSNPGTTRSVERSLRKPKPSGGMVKKITNPKKAVLSKLPGGSEGGALKNIADRAYATEVSLSTLSWGTWVWITLQLPFAILALVFFSLAGAVEYLREKSGVVGDVVTTVASWVGGVLKFFLGIDLSLFNPENIFMLTNAVTWFVGLATLIAIGLTYTLAGIPCLSGKATALKYITLIMACVAYAIPVLNIFPWAIFWVLVVWFFPTDEAI